MANFQKGERVRLRSIPQLVGSVVLDGVLGSEVELVCIAFDELSFPSLKATVSLAQSGTVELIRNWVTLPVELVELDLPDGVTL